MQLNGGEFLLADLDTFRVLARVQLALNAKAGSGGGGSDQVDDDFMAHQRFAAPVLRDEGKQTMLDFVPTGYPLDSPRPNLLCRLLFGFGTADQSIVSLRRGAGCLLHEPEKELAAALRLPAVEPKSEFIQVVRQVLRCHCALVSTEQPPLQQACDPVNARH